MKVRRRSQKEWHNSSRVTTSYLITSSNILQLPKAHLGNDCTELSGSGGNAMCGGTVTCGEGLTRNNERRCIRTEVLEKVGKAVEEHKCILAMLEHGVVAETL